MPETANKPKIQRNRHRLYQVSRPSTTAAIPDSEPQSAATDKAQPLDPHIRYQKARSLVDYHSAVAGMVGVIPIPIVDTFSTGLLQLKMIRDLSKLYNVPFSEQRTKAAMASLIGGLQTGLMVHSFIKFIPVVGYAVMAIPLALTAGGLTQAIGRVFIYHFELGGTLLDFNAQRMRSYFRQQLRRKDKKAKTADSDG